MIILLWASIFVVSLAVLLKSSDFFTDAAESIGLSFGLSPLVIGVTIVALGTSLPELGSSIFAVLNNSSEIVGGNVIGSNIANILLVLGVGAIVGKTMRIQFSVLSKPLIFLFASMATFYFFAKDGIFTATEGVIALVCYAAYIIYSIFGKTSKTKESSIRPDLQIKHVLILIISIIAIFFSAKYTVISIQKLSEICNIAQGVIAATAVAFGTSLPELAVSISAAKKGKVEMVFGNVIGSNIFNTLVVTSIPSFIGSLTIPSSMINFSIPVMIIATTLLFLICLRNRILKIEGIVFNILYIAFILKTFSVI